MTKRGQQQTSIAPKRKGSERGSPFWSIWSRQRSPKRPPRAPKRSPRGPQHALNTMFEHEEFIFQTSMNVWARIKAFEARRVILEGQNRPREVPRRGHGHHWSTTFRGQRLLGEDNWSKKNEQFNKDSGSNTPMARGLAKIISLLMYWCSNRLDAQLISILVYCCFGSWVS